MVQINNKCTACGACIQICPKNAITLQETDKKICYPVIDSSKCVECGLCERVCPIPRDNTTAKEIGKCYACCSKDSDIVERSTSGGVFSELAKYVLTRNGVVYGCALLGHLQATHVRIDNTDELFMLNGSKYVQSSIGDTFQKAKLDLETGKPVLYSGTPCQIAGLKGFLGKNYDNLICVDIICHGVAPQSYFDKYIQWYENKNRITVMDYDFRSKKNSGWSLAGICNYSNSNINRTKNIFYFNEFYYFYFLKGHIYRESCYACKYASTVRQGDFTLGDFWGIEKKDIDFDIQNGCSLLLVNTEKAENILQMLNLYKTLMPIEKAVIGNRQLCESSKKPDNAEEIKNRFVSMSGDQIDKLFKKENILVIAKGWVKYHLLSSIVRMIKQF